jgi:hypothetical protein
LSRSFVPDQTRLYLTTFLFTKKAKQTAAGGRLAVLLKTDLPSACLSDLSPPLQL